MDPNKARFAHILELFVTLDDARAITDALRAKFPALRIVAQEYWQAYVDMTTYLARQRTNIRRQERGEPSLFNPVGVIDPADRGLVYYDSFGDLSELDFGAWIEPPDWRPDWQWRGECYLIANLPDAFLIFSRNRFLYRDLRHPDRWQVDSRPIRRHEATHKAYLSPGTFTGAWSRDSDEARRFVAKSMRVLKAMTTDRFVWVDTATHRPFANSAISGGAAVRVAADAARWALSGRYNYLGSWNAAMAMKPADYPYSPEDFMPHPKGLFAPKPDRRGERPKSGGRKGPSSSGRSRTKRRST